MRIGLLKDDARIAIAVSGGADSLALCALARQLYPRERLVALHVQHNLEGVSEDAEHTMRILAGLDIEGEVLQLQWKPGEAAALSKGKLMEALRERRYAALYAACRRRDVRLVLTGHNSDDDIVTMFYRMSHGSGNDGLAGMKLLSTFPVSDRHAGEHFIGHPLLEVAKERLVKTCEEANLQWHWDLSNADGDYSRNALQTVLSDLVGRGVCSVEKLQECLQLFKEFRADVHEDVLPVLEKSVSLDKQRGDAILILNDARWLNNFPVATRVVSLLSQYAGCKFVGLKTARIREITSALREAAASHQQNQQKLASMVLKRTGTASLQPYDRTRRVNTGQMVMGGSVFYSMSQADGLRRVTNVLRAHGRRLDYGAVFLVQREPPVRYRVQDEAFGEVTVTLRPGETYLWDGRFYLSYRAPSPTDTLPRTFRISHMTVASVSAFEALTQSASMYRRHVYSYLGCTPSSHIYNVPVVREDDYYMAFPCLKAQFPSRYEWEVSFVGGQVLQSRMQLLP